MSVFFSLIFYLGYFVSLKKVIKYRILIGNKIKYGNEGIESKLLSEKYYYY